MNKYNCTYNSGSYLYRVGCVAENEKAARDIAFDAADRRWRGYVGKPEKWNAVLVESSVYGPARVLDITYS